MPALCLCAGDKTPSFVGSRNWIGAIELGYVLGELLHAAKHIRYYGFDRLVWLSAQATSRAASWAPGTGSAQSSWATCWTSDWA